MVNRSPDFEDVNNEPESKVKRPPLPSIHITSKKYLNESGNTFDFLKRNPSRKVIHERKSLDKGQEMAQEVHAGEWKSLLQDSNLSSKDRYIKVT